MKPYKNLTSKNLALVLLLARAFVYLGLVFLALSVFMFATMTSPYSGMLGLTTGVAILPLALVMFFVSSLLAAIVAFEEHYRVRTEHFVSQRDLS